MLPPSYTKAVLADYRQKLAAGILSLNIRQLSPASLKDACLEIRRKRYRRNDELPLMAYFGEGSNEQACLRAIDNLEIDKFRPLVYFLKGKTKNPDDKVVELVAWLIDFNERPYDPAKNYSIAQEPSQQPSITTVIEITPEESDDNDNEPHPISPNPDQDASRPSPSEPGKNRKKVIIAITITITLAMIINWPWHQNSTHPIAEGKACMFWSDDHYQPINCNKKVDNVQIIALDTAILYHFKKINQPDTITFNALGSVWYVKYRGHYEFYTNEGFHPLDPTLRLKPITQYIISRYIHINP